jgi:hypothetical protein
MKAMKWSDRGKVANFLIKHGVLVDRERNRRPSTRQWLWGAGLILTFAAVFALLALNVLVFGRGFTNDPFTYVVAILMLVVVALCLAILMYWGIKFFRTRGQGDT